MHGKHLAAGGGDRRDELMQPCVVAGREVEAALPRSCIATSTSSNASSATISVKTTPPSG